MDTVISYSDYYLPEKPLTLMEFINKLNDDFVNEWGDTFFGGDVTREDLAEIIKNTTKIFNVGVLERKDEGDAFSILFNRYFESGKNKDDIDFIIYTRGDSVYEEVNMPYFLQNKFAIKNTQVFSIEQECSATLMAIKLAKSLISDGSAKKIIILSKNIYESYEKRLMGLFIVSDGVGLMEVTKNNTGLAPLDFVSSTNGAIGNVRALSFKANEIVDTGVSLINSILQKNGLTMSDIKLIIPQNTNISGWNIYTQRLNFDLSKIFKDNFGGIGHLGDVDMIRNITDISKKDLLQNGELALAYALGTGTTWNSMLFKKI